MDFGKEIRRIRIENDWTLEEMAQKLGTTKQALSKYERGERTPKITVAAKFATILGVPLEELIGEPSGGMKFLEYRQSFHPDLIKMMDEIINRVDRTELEKAMDVYCSLSKENRETVFNYMNFLKHQENVAARAEGKTQQKK